MDLQEAKSRAYYLCQLTKMDFVVTKTNNDYYVFEAENWTGDVLKKYSYEDKKPAKKSKSIPELSDTSDKEILPGD